ncbi:hypothetical protein SCLCIDRAFT_1143860 [Scleroderma citrinum Foug A]|uniref:Uncharacterized protein n=1 Tax=Scleroderma citrinum Foug A TaxID=1036808 RepID=A0A0C2Z560_9AGAM|nr:hypothetical protein SCLCIDRAFT_1143860 [Scleroderma citrinum Foug A]
MIWLVQSILQMRLYALYDCSRKVMSIMGLAFVLEILAMSTILLRTNLTTGASNEPLPGVKFCTNEDMSRSFCVFWLPVLCFECLLCSLAVWAGIQRSKDGMSPMVVSNKVCLLDILIRGNVGYFLAIFLAGVVNAVMWATLPGEWIEVPEGFPHAVTVIAGCRLILHVRNAASPPLTGSTHSIDYSLAFVYSMQITEVNERV